MKRIVYIAICIALVANLAACGNNSKSSAVLSPVYPKSIPFEDYDGRQAITKENPVDKSYMDGLNNFSYDSASKILKGQSSNITYSPLSLYIALALAGTGAGGTTQDEIFSTLGVSGKETDFLSNQTSNLFRRLYSDNEVGKLKIANSIWLKKDIKFKETFIKNAVENFYASSYKVDFSDDNTAKLMSKWISENTNDILSPEIDINPLQIMSIINTVYFKDEWVDRFEENNTKPDIFYLKDGSQIECDFMNMTYNLPHGYTKGEGYTRSALSLKNSGSMIFILPDKGVSVDDLLLNKEKVALLFDGEEKEEGEVTFQIPKFSFGSKLDLNGTLKAMGITSAFEGNADFKGITDDTASISEVEQQTHIAIDEKGVEAAAFTKIDYWRSVPPNGEITKMILNRPFIFAIKSYDGTILFVGVVNNPKEGK